MPRIAAAAAVLISTVALTLPAAAEPPSEVARRDVPLEHRHDPNKALAFSLGGTLVPLAMISAGAAILVAGNGPYADNRLAPLLAPATALVVVGGGLSMFGPALGHSYGEHRWRTTGFKVRALGLAVATAGFTPLLMAGLGCGESCWVVGLGIEGVAAATYVTGMVIDIATARSATERWNAKQGRPPVWITPVAIRTPSHAMAAGLGITGRF
jgi:hypothetical protein